MRKEVLDSIGYVDAKLIDKTESYVPKKKKAGKHRWGLIAACLCLCIIMTVPVLAAADNGIAYEALYMVAPSLAQKLKPINTSCEDNGIEMKVIAAEIDGENANILVALTDKTGSRLDETTDLFDSYDIHTPYDQMGGCSLVEFDPDTNTAVFMLTIEQMNHVLIPGNKITFSINQILTGKKHSNTELQQIDLSNVPDATEFKAQSDIRGCSGCYANSDVSYPLLMEPNENAAVCLTPGISLMGYGMIDNQLHVQIRYDDILHTDNHGYPYLKDVNGNVIYSAGTIAFWADDTGNSYEEHVFPTKENLSDYEIWGEFWTCNEGPIEGNWQVTFRITNK